MIKRHSILTAILLCFVAFTQVMAQEMQEPEPLPIDPKVRYGKLSNGLTYYIRHNDQPKDRADFYIAQNVGSILEEDNQRGLAHFLEHMAFDGSRNFPNNGMDEYIESVGMRSGENFNAYTSFDETVYMITNAPVNKSGVVDSCLLILHDWSGFLALTDSAIQKERGVIREEWRTRQDAQTRLWEQQLPKMYPGSRYANRMPIGSIDVIENFKPDELRALTDLAHRHGMYVHMDGARLANACAALNLGFRELTVDCGIDILSFGGTKNGLMLGESVVVFNPALKKEAYFVRKQSAQLASKLRYLSCQFTAYLTDSLWLKNAAHANRMAKILYDGLKELPGAHFTQKVESNQLFLTMPRPVIDELLKDYFFYFWDEAIHEIRFVTSFDTTEEDIEQLLQSVKRLL